MEHKILLEQSVGDTSRVARIGGKALLPDIHEWPENPDKEPLVLIVSLPASFLNERIGLSMPSNLYVSVFSTYSKDGYFLDSITYNGEKNTVSDIGNKYTRVVIHEEGKPRNESLYLIPALEIVTGDIPEDNNNYTGSKIGDTPGWLQNEIFDLEKFIFILQLYSSDFPQEYEDIFYLTDAVGYLFVNENYSEGRFFVQST